MKWFAMLNSTGYQLARELPSGCVLDCSEPGQDAAEAVEFWIKDLDFSAPALPMRAYLKTFGAWDNEELDDYQANLERLLWSICCDERDNAMRGGSITYEQEPELNPER